MAATIFARDPGRGTGRHASGGGRVEAAAVRPRTIQRREGDVAGARRVMVVGASMAAVLWPGQDPLGKCVRVEDQRPFRPPEDLPCTYVVGVAEDIHTQSLGPETRYFYYYVPAAQLRPCEGGLYVRVRGDPSEFVEPLRRRLQQEMPSAAYVIVTRLAENIERETRSWVMGATVFTAFGALALVLAAGGLLAVRGRTRPSPVGPPGRVCRGRPPGA